MKMQEIPVASRASPPLPPPGLLPLDPTWTPGRKGEPSVRFAHFASQIFAPPHVENLKPMTLAKQQMLRSYFQEHIIFFKCLKHEMGIKNMYFTILNSIQIYTVLETSSYIVIG